MLLCIIFGVVFLIGCSAVVVYKIANDGEKHPKLYELYLNTPETIVCIMLAGLGIGIGGLLACGMLMLCSKSAYASEKAKIEYVEKYNVLREGMKKDNGYLMLASDISDYNTEVLQGRMKLENIWVKDFTYDFWYDLELIEVGCDSGLNKED